MVQLNNAPEAFSCGFFSESLNFNVTNLRKPKKEVNRNAQSVIDFLERGYPTRPTHYLISKLREHDPNFSWEELKNLEPILLRPFSPDYGSTIKGSDEHQLFPAQTFFNQLIDEHLPDYNFIKNLLIPECKFSDILAFDIEAVGVEQDWEVDFFFPQIDLVIEIDGPQHGEQVQRRIDSRRYEILRKHVIRQHRVETYKINRNSHEIRNYFTALRKDLEQSEQIQKIKSFVDEKRFNGQELKYDLVAISRLQRLLIEQICRGHFDEVNNHSLEIITDFNSTIRWQELALEDLKNTYEHFRYYEKTSAKFPFIKISEVKEFSDEPKTTKIRFNLLQHNDDTFKDAGVIYVHNHQLNAHYIPSKDTPLKRRNVFHKPLTNKGIDQIPVRGLRKNLKELSYLTFGHSDFRTGQFEIISASLTSHATLGLLPTGGGKSLCFQLPGAIFPGCTVVVCPITALVRDHFLELSEFGFNSRADFISSEKTGSSRDYVLHKWEQGQLKFLFVSPEQFQKKSFREHFKSMYGKGLLNRVVIDEVHCISEWGHDFRTSYLNLAGTIKKFGPEVPITCLTATASVKVIEDIQIEFDLESDDVSYHMDSSREELTFRLQKPENKAKYLKEILQDRYASENLNNQSPFIIFCPLKNDNQVGNRLGVSGITDLARESLPSLKIGSFTGDPHPKAWQPHLEFEAIGETSRKPKNYDTFKETVQRLFKANKLAGIVATKAFGMGVNKPNVRMTIHNGMPASMEALYQEAGRAGRDQKPADCITIFTPEKQIPEKLHDANVDLEELTKMFKEMTNGGDLNQQLYFLTSSNKTIETELEECAIVLSSLRKKGSEGLFILNEENVSQGDGDVINTSRDRTKEKTIYRLKQLGYISDWTVENFKNGIYEVDWKDQNTEEVSDRIIKTIKKYTGTDANLEKLEIKIGAVISRKDVVPEKGLMRVLLKWNYEHFVYNRRQSLKNLYEECENFESPEKFKTKLESYFKSNQSFDALLNIIKLNARDAVTPTISLFLTPKGNLRSHNRIDKLSMTIARYLESYQNNPGLNLTSAFIRIWQEDFQNADGRPRLQSFLEALGSYEDCAQEVEKIIELICALKSQDVEEAVTLIIVYFKSVDLAGIALQYCDCDFAESLVFENINSRLEAVI